MPTEEVRCQRIARAIQDYLFAHPLAADTIRGIVDWWLPATEQESLELRDVQAALEILIMTGVAQKQRLADGREIFTARKSRN